VKKKQYFQRRWKILCLFYIKKANLLATFAVFILQSSKERVAGIFFVEFYSFLYAGNLKATQKNIEL
jgi:hypothetical protein